MFDFIGDILGSLFSDLFEAGIDAYFSRTRWMSLIYIPLTLALAVFIGWLLGNAQGALAGILGGVITFVIMLPLTAVFHGRLTQRDPSVFDNPISPQDPPL